MLYVVCTRIIIVILLGEIGLRSMVMEQCRILRGFMRMGLFRLGVRSVLIRGAVVRMIGFRRIRKMEVVEDDILVGFI